MDLTEKLIRSHGRSKGKVIQVCFYVRISKELSSSGIYHMGIGQGIGRVGTRMRERSLNILNCET